MYLSYGIKVLLVALVTFSASMSSAAELAESSMDLSALGILLVGVMALLIGRMAKKFNRQ